MPIGYDFKSASQNTPVRRGAGWKRLRFLGVLCIVAAVTVGVIMLIVPEHKTPATKESVAAGKSDIPASGTSNVSSDYSGENKNTSGSEINNGSSDVSEKSNNSAWDNRDREKNTHDSGEKESVSGKSFSKDVVTQDDLSADEDRPVFRPSQAAGAAETLAKAAALNDPDAAIELLSGFLMKEYSAGGEFSENWNVIGRELGSAIVKKWQNRNLKQQATVHKVVGGDHFIRISRRYDTTVEAMRFINNRKGNMIRIGERLTVLSGPWKITVSKKARLLNVWRKVKDSWQIFAVFPIGVGRKNSTPEGAFVINVRLRHPKWHGPDGRVFPYGDKENPLGDYFLKLKSLSAKAGGYGIHGSSNDSSVGRSLSNGCIRMRNSDVELLYYLLPVSTPVKIMD